MSISKIEKFREYQVDYWAENGILPYIILDKIQELITAVNELNKYENNKRNK